MDVRIIALHRRPDLVAPAAKAMATIWPDYYDASGPGDAVADLRDRCRATGVPFGMIAIEGDTVVGGGALSGQSYGADKGEGPWIVGLFVIAEKRRLGIASDLVTALTKQARNGGFDQVFATTQDATGLLRQLGWTQRRQISDAEGKWQVLHKDL